MKKLKIVFAVFIIMAMSSSTFAWDQVSDIKTIVGGTEMVIGTLHSSGTITSDIMCLSGKVVKKNVLVLDRQLLFCSYYDRGYSATFGEPNGDSVIFDDHDGYYQGKVTGVCWWPSINTGVWPESVKHMYYD